MSPWVASRCAALPTNDILKRSLSNLGYDVTLVPKARPVLDGPMPHRLEPVLQQRKLVRPMFQLNG